MITYNVATEDFTTGERAGAAIFRYSARIQSIIKAKVPAEPFMHICQDAKHTIQRTSC
jgi:hypothetical protein